MLPMLFLSKVGVPVLCPYGGAAHASWTGTIQSISESRPVVKETLLDLSILHGHADAR